MSLEKSGKALFDDELKSGELLVWIYKMILTVDRKHTILFCKSNDRISAHTIVFANGLTIYFASIGERSRIPDGSFFHVYRR